MIAKKVKPVLFLQVIWLHQCTSANSVEFIGCGGELCRRANTALLALPRDALPQVPLHACGPVPPCLKSRAPTETERLTGSPLAIAATRCCLFWAPSRRPAVLCWRTHTTHPSCDSDIACWAHRCSCQKLEFVPPVFLAVAFQGALRLDSQWQVA